MLCLLLSEQLCFSGRKPCEEGGGAAVKKDVAVSAVRGGQ